MSAAVSYLVSGRNNNGDLGLGHKNEVNKPTPLPDPTVVLKTVDAWQESVKAFPSEFAGVNLIGGTGGRDFFVVWDDKGRLFSWGAGVPNGHGVTAVQRTPKLIEFFSSRNIFVVQASAGENFVLALTNDGHVYSWGDKQNGVLGHSPGGGTVLTPTIIRGLHHVRSVAAGWNHSLYLLENGQLLQSGTADFGWRPSIHETLAAAGTEIVQIAAGNGVSAAVAVDGSVYTWGNGSTGALGHGNNANLAVPTLIKDFPVKGVQVRAASVLPALLYVHGEGTQTLPSTRGATSPGRPADGLYYYVTGLNNSNDLGLWHKREVTVPVLIEDPVDQLDVLDKWEREAQTFPEELVGVRLISGSSGRSFSVAVDDQGGVWSWGSGIGAGHGKPDVVPKPKRIEALWSSGVKIKEVSAGEDHVLAVTRTGDVYTWGSKGQGNLGHPPALLGSAHLLNPTMISGLHHIRSVAAGWSHSLYLREDGRILASGSGGHDNRGGSYRPLLIDAPSIVDVDIVQIAAGNGFSYAVASDGTIYSWGAGARGVLAQGSNANVDKPTPIKPINGASSQLNVRVSSGGTFALFVQGKPIPPSTKASYPSLENASVRYFVTGLNNSNDLGLWHAKDVLTPVPIEDPVDQFAVINKWQTEAKPFLNAELNGVELVSGSSGRNFTIVLDSVGGLWSWGAGVPNGHGVTAPLTTPKRIASLWDAGVRFKQVSAGGDFAVAIATDGSAYSWGEKNQGVLGHPKSINGIAQVLAPTKIAGVSGAVQAAAGKDHTIILLENGSIIACGLGAALGTGKATAEVTPVLVQFPALGSGSRVVSISAGNGVSVALTSDGAVYTWGNGRSLGHGDTKAYLVPTRVAAVDSLPRITSAIAGAWDSNFLLLTSSKTEGTTEGRRGVRVPAAVSSWLSSVSGIVSSEDDLNDLVAQLNKALGDNAKFEVRPKKF